ARSLLSLPKHATVESWLESLTTQATEPDRIRPLVEELEQSLEPPAPQLPAARPPTSLTFAQTSRRSFEVAYWKTIALLAEGRYVNKNNADCIQDAVTAMRLPHHRRDLEELGDYILSYYERVIAAARMQGKALAGELPFVWHTDFDFCWYGG